MTYKERRSHERQVLRSAVYNKTDGICAYCGVKVTFDGFNIDHVIPRRRYKNRPRPAEVGSNTIENLLPSCPSCNLCKTDKSLEQFREQIISRVDMLNLNSKEYKIAKRFGLVQEIEKPIVFYFETIQ